MAALMQTPDTVCTHTEVNHRDPKYEHKIYAPQKPSTYQQRLLHKNQIT